MGAKFTLNSEEYGHKNLKRCNSHVAELRTNEVTELLAKGQWGEPKLLAQASFHIYLSLRVIISGT